MSARSSTRQELLPSPVPHPINMDNWRLLLATFLRTTNPHDCRVENALQIYVTGCLLIENLYQTTPALPPNAETYRQSLPFSLLLAALPSASLPVVGELIIHPFYQDVVIKIKEGGDTSYFARIDTNPNRARNRYGAGVGLFVYEHGGLGVGTGLAILTNLLGQINADYLFPRRQKIIMQIVDRAHSADYSAINNDRYLWTSALAAMGKDWTPSRRDPTQFAKTFYPQRKTR